MSPSLPSPPGPETGIVASRAEVILTAPSGSVRTSAMLVDGSFAFFSVAEGVYTLDVAAKGLVYPTTVVEIKSTSTGMVAQATTPSLPSVRLIYNAVEELLGMMGYKFAAAPVCFLSGHPPAYLPSFPAAGTSACHVLSHSHPPNGESGVFRGASLMKTARRSESGCRYYSIYQSTSLPTSLVQKPSSFDIIAFMKTPYGLMIGAMRIE